jgi:hypothetical protein
MTSMLVQVIVAFWLLLFGAMAIVPFLLDSKSTHPVHAADPTREDRVISILPIGTRDAGVQTPASSPASILAAANARAQAATTRNDRSHHAA